jgi:uncharacterized protein (DUF488 family)
MTLFTVGHSNRTLEFLVSLLQGYEIQRLVDIRTIPRSRHNPQFNLDVLPAMLKALGIAYTHAPALGGLRRPRPDSHNDGWKNKSFRGYADYMQTPEFEGAIRELIGMAKNERIAIMCAEAVPWRCHRSLVADSLTVRGVSVQHIMSRVSAPKHQVTRWARVEGDQILYSGELMKSDRRQNSRQLELI